MELSDSAVIIDILANCGQPNRRKQPRMTKLKASPETGYEPPRAKSTRTRRCPCGVCDSCLENARWEKIFQQKFADPYYYSRPQRRASSLNW